MTHSARLVESGGYFTDMVIRGDGADRGPTFDEAMGIAIRYGVDIQHLRDGKLVATSCWKTKTTVWELEPK
jgi:hypothetical protein